MPRWNNTDAPDRAPPGARGAWPGTLATPGVRVARLVAHKQEHELSGEACSGHNVGKRGSCARRACAGGARGRSGHGKHTGCTQKHSGSPVRPPRLHASGTGNLVLQDFPAPGPIAVAVHPRHVAEDWCAFRHRRAQLYTDPPPVIHGGAQSKLVLFWGPMRRSVRHTWGKHGLAGPTCGPTGAGGPGRPAQSGRWRWARARASGAQLNKFRTARIYPTNYPP